MTLPHRAASSAKNFPASAGEPIIGSSINLCNVALTSGRLRLSTTSRLILRTTAGSNPGGATIANQVSERKPGNPASDMVGTSGTTAERSELPTARILTFAARYIGTDVVIVS